MEMLWQDLVNTDWHDYRGTKKDEDRLLKPGWIESLLEGWKMQGVDPPTQETIAALQQLRTLLQRMIQAFKEQRQPSESDIAMLNAYFEHAPLRYQLESKKNDYILEQVPYKRDWTWVLGRIAVSFAEVMAYHDPSRIKQCENPDCRWVYYDESGNRTRRWCEESCANIMRVRRFRERHHRQSKPKKMHLQ